MLDLVDYITDADAEAILMKYNYDRVKHVKAVTKYTLLLFDHLAERYSFSSADRNLLKYSALFHDIGYYIDKEDHHKHTRGLILSAHEFEAIPNILKFRLALISSSHRKKIWNKIQLFPVEEQNRLCQLISILRIGDAVDHAEQVNFILDKRGGFMSLHLVLQQKNSLQVLEKLDKKSALFKKLFQMDIKIYNAVGNEKTAH